MRVWIVLPAYNEAENLQPMFEGFRKLVKNTYNLDLRVMIIDDGSTDNTGAVAGKIAGDLTVQVLVNERNMGLAATLMRGLVEAARVAHADDVIVCMDADNSHLPGQTLRLVREIEEGRDVVVVSRYQAGAVVRGVSLYRRLLSRGMSTLFRIVYPIKGVKDYSCGYRAYRAGFLQEAIATQGDSLFALDDGFACMVALLLRLHKQDGVFGEIPIVLRYDRKAGASKMKVGRTVMRTLRVLLRERFSKR